MRIFLSSTCYDLQDLRAEVEAFLKGKGHELLLSDRANFPVDVNKHRHDVCVDNVAACEVFVLVIDGRFGAPYYKNPDISITWAEFKEALANGKKIIPFVRSQVFNERQSCRHNQKQGNSFSPFFAEDLRVFDFIDEIQKHEGGYWIQQFENSVQVKERLENLYETNHSLLNVVNGPVLATFSDNNIPLSNVSGSTASYITKFVSGEKVDHLTEDLIDKALSSLPKGVTPWGELLGHEQIPGPTDYYYFRPLFPAGDEGEVFVGISPTALGDAVRKELEDLKHKISKK